MAVYCVPAFGKFGRSSDFKQKADEAKMLMQRTYLLSRSPENTSVQAYRMIVQDQKFKLQRTDDNVSWTEVTTVERLDDNSSNPAAGKDLETIQCDANCYILTCPVNPSLKCDLTNHTKLPIKFIDNKLNSNNTSNKMNDMATFGFEGVKEDGLSITTSSKPFNVILKFSRQ